MSALYGEYTAMKRLALEDIVREFNQLPLEEREKRFKSAIEYERQVRALLSTAREQRTDVDYEMIEEMKPDPWPPLPLESNLVLDPENYKIGVTHVIR